MTSHFSYDLSIARQISVLYRGFQKYCHYWFYDDLNASSQSMTIKETPLPRLLTLSIYTLSGATAAFLIWATLTPVKELARTEGQILPSGYSQLVQHLEGGLVREILIHEGDFVQKEQLLLRLDGAGLEEDFQEQQVLVEALSLHAERLHALLENREPNFSGITTLPSSIIEQKRMFETTKASHTSERAILEEQIAQKRATITRLEQALATAQSNLSVAEENKDIYTRLNAKGLAARTAYLKKQQEFNSQEGDVNVLIGQIKESKIELAEFERRREALVAQQRDTAYAELHKVESDLAQAQEMLKKRNDRVKRLEVRAPVAGYVKGLKLNTIGSVIPAGQTLMEVVPMGEQLIVEARILPQQIGRVAVGQEVQIKVDSFDYVRFGTIPGTLEAVSAMTFSDEGKQQNYYKGRIKLARNYAGPVPSEHKLLPGMTVDADIVTGEKSVLAYLLKPIQVALHNAMTEK